MLVVWIALVAGVVALVVGVVHAYREGRALWREARRVSGRFADELAAMERSSAEIDGHLAAAERSSRELDASLARLRRSRAELNVLLSAIQAVRDSAGGLTALMPRK